MNDSRDVLRKAAILVHSLDPQSADLILEQMGPEQAARVRSAMMELDEISPEEQREVMAQFLQRSPRDSGVQLELSASAAAPTVGEVTPQSPEAPEPSPSAMHRPSHEADDDLPTTPFRFLHDASTTALIRVLEQEHPQTVAVVLAHVKPQLAADVLSELPESMQTEVLRRVAQLDATDPAIVADLERQMERLLSDHIRSRQRRAAGQAAVQAILDAAVPHRRRQLLDRWQSADTDADRAEDPASEADKPERSLAAAPTQAFNSRADRSPVHEDANGALPKPNAPLQEQPAVPIPNSVNSAPFDQSATPVPQEPDAEPPAELHFDTLLLMEPHSLQRVFSAVDSDLLCLALVGAAPALTERLLQPLSRRDARRLRRRIELQGPLRLDDVERAQQHVCDVAARLAAAGQIQLPTPRGFAAAA